MYQAWWLFVEDFIWKFCLHQRTWHPICDVDNTLNAKVPKVLGQKIIGDLNT